MIVRKTKCVLKTTTQAMTPRTIMMMTTVFTSKNEELKKSEEMARKR